MKRAEMERMRRGAVCIGLLAAALIAGPCRAEQPADYTQALEIVEELHGKLLDVMKRSGELDYEGRYRELEPVILARFDTPLIVQVILSRYWNDLNEQQRTDFINLFNRLSIGTYASRFNSFSGEQFVEQSPEELKKGRLLVRTELQRPDKKPVQLDYLMQQREDGSWFIISVIANGVNDLSLKRAEYASVIKDHGYDGLVRQIEQKVADLDDIPVEPL